MSASDLADDIVQSERPQHIEAVAKTFKPWHRVRKQYIRERQWNHEITFLAKRFLERELQTTETEFGSQDHTGAPQADTDATAEKFLIERPLRCLVLPSDELLDIRSLWEALKDKGYYIRFLGFNSGLVTPELKKAMSLSEGAVVQLSKICKDSHVLSDPFQNIGNPKSQAYNQFRRYGPYDVVNLDLCDFLVPRGKAQETQRNFTAIHQVIDFQIKKQMTPWLFFATTQVDREQLHQGEINTLAQALRNNCDDHIDFSKALSELIPEAAFKSDEHKLDISHLEPNDLVRVFGVVLGKWLIHLFEKASPKASVSLLRSYRYVIRADKNVEMLSLGFLIQPCFISPVDSTGTSNLEPAQRNFPTELEAAINMVDVAGKIEDVDQILARETKLRDELIISKAQLLAACGYDGTKYMDWALSGESEQS